jgi:hypothetical protein
MFVNIKIELDDNNCTTSALATRLQALACPLHITEGKELQDLSLVSLSTGIEIFRVSITKDK